MRIDYHELHSALEGFPALTRLVLSGGDALHAWSPTVPIIDLPALRFLHIGTDPEDISRDVSGILITISAPSLQSLVLNYILGEELEDFFGRNSTNFPSLRSLTIGFVDNPPDPHVWTGLSHAFPTITHLSVFYQDTPSFLEFLQLPRAFGEFDGCDTYPSWPSLHQLTVIDYNGEAEAYMICNMVSARITSKCPLRSIRLSESTMHAVKDLLEWLRERVQVEQGEISTVSWFDSGLWSIQDDVIVVRAY